MAVIGIDLGTTNSLAGVWQDGKVVLIPNAFGEYLTPSVVSIGKNQEVFSCGQCGKRNACNTAV